VAKVERVAKTWRQRVRGIMVRVGRTVLLAYVVVLIVFEVMQTRLVFPGMATQGTAESEVSPPPGSELVRLTTAEGVPTVGLFCKARLGDGAVDPAAGKRATMIYFYGNAMCLKDAVEDCEGFSRLGGNVLGVEFPGYGMAGGEASEKNCYAAAEAGYRYVLGRGDVDGKLIVPCGWSLGAAVAIDLAARHEGEGHICGVMTFSAFTSMVEVGRYHYPMLPVSTMLRHRFDSVGKIGRVKVPLLMGHGERDEIVPFAMAERLAKAAGGPVTRLNVPMAGHNDFFEVGEEQVNTAVRSFLSKVTKGR
jgi:pimeloyl-ACP methyl ester carboxylesterase